MTEPDKTNSYPDRCALRVLEERSATLARLIGYNTPAAKLSVR